MKPIVAGRIGDLVVRERDSLEFSLWITGMCICMHVCVYFQGEDSIGEYVGKDVEVNYTLYSIYVAKFIKRARFIVK